MQVTSTSGPDLLSGDILPQMFLSFRGSAIYIRSSPASNAMANIIISSSSNAIRTMQFNSSVGVIGAIGLPEDTLILAVTYILGSGRLDIQTIALSVPNTSATSSYLPPIPSPSSSSALPISSAQTPSQHARKNKGTTRRDSGTSPWCDVAGEFGHCCWLLETEE